MRGTEFSPRRASIEALARLSNASAAVQPNAKPDIRGFAVKVLGVAGAAALGGAAEAQDFLFVNQTSFGARDSDEFVDLVADSRRGLPAVALGLIRRNGLVGGLKRLKRLAATVGRPFSGFAGETFDTLAPFTVGPYAARARLTPVKPAPAGGKDFADDMRDRLAAGPLVYAMALQFFVDEGSTPIEDPTVAWPEDRAPPARRRASDARGGRTRRRRAAVRSLGRARRPPPARRDHARAQGSVFSQSEGARRAVRGLPRWSGGGRSGARLRRIVALQVTDYCNSKTPIPARAEVTARPFARANH